MWRALFLAMGIYCCVLGVEALAIDKAVLVRSKPSVSQNAFVPFPQMAAQREIVPPSWAPWSLIAAGSVVVLYSFSIPRRVKD